MNDIRRIANDFRNAIEQAIDNGDIIDINMSRFPKGCCTYASDLLQRYLYEQGIRTWLVSGIYKNGVEGESHSWIRLEDGKIVDITGDQYSDRKDVVKYTERVFVGFPDRFHKLFKCYPPVLYFPKEDSFGKTQQEIKMDKCYEAILKYMR